MAKDIPKGRPPICSQTKKGTRDGSSIYNPLVKKGK